MVPFMEDLIQVMVFLIRIHFAIWFLFFQLITFNQIMDFHLIFDQLPIQSPFFFYFLYNQNVMMHQVNLENLHDDSSIFQDDLMGQDDGLARPYIIDKLHSFCKINSLIINGLRISKFLDIRINLKSSRSLKLY